ncbi:MAG: HAMP domain-containing protein [Deltaproteobacteria bacterium]|nr:HAMP domain-containing protein [Deltaproteobacteria bacterium]
MALYKSRLLWKINAIFVTITLLAALIVSALSAHLIKQSTLREVEENLGERCALLGELALPLLGEGKVAELQEKVLALGGETHTRLTIIAPDGTVAADSEKQPESMENHGDRPEIKKAALYAQGVATRLSATLSTDMMYLAQAIRHQQQIIGYARTSLPLTVIDQRINQSRKVIVLGIGVVALLTLLSGFLLARFFIHPLVTMTAMAEALAAGDLSRRLKLRRRDEIGRLARSFNQMAENSQQRIATIEFDRKKLNAILSAMTEGVIAVDHRENIIHINQAAAALLGTDTKSTMGKPIWEITRLPDLFNIISEARKSVGEVKKTMKISHGLRERIIEMHAAPLRDGQEEIVGAMVVMLDVSELRHLETVRRDFVINASHELKTPITAIRALTETMLDDFSGMDDRTKLSFLNKISNQSLRLTAIIVDLMALSRFELEDEWNHRTPVDVGRLLDDSAQSLSPAAESKNITVKICKIEKNLEIEGDENALLQAVTNLLDNAIKYTPEGGRVELRLRGDSRNAIIEVADTGIGIEPEDQERIFERFYRVDKARSRELGGTGLGLSIVRHIIKSHKGRVRVESRPGAGSTFIISLPLTTKENGDKN